ncbi:SirB2 family protein [Oceanospirillum beijerinckii]|uniref:SirB2 family protein n=1 Tax=Oceanospirillum beijerinckii TaxID=64976 RepID=UPI00041F1AED|nr:SirB2 family protein [Oceanospirillum beijerinckii]
MYGAIKHIHLVCITLSITLFALRGFWMLVDSHWLQKRWLNRATYLIDTLLLGSAISLVVMLQQYPFVDHWLTAKVLAMLLYIALGAIALRRGKTKVIRTLALIGALASVGYIIGAALNHHPLSWLAS